MVQDGCQDPIAAFSARLGLYIEGSVSPPLLNVSIQVVAESDSYISSLRKGDISLETSTGADGLFIAGPLYDDIDYSIEASKVWNLIYIVYILPITSQFCNMNYTCYILVSSGCATSPHV